MKKLIPTFFLLLLCASARAQEPAPMPSPTPAQIASQNEAFTKRLIADSFRSPIYAQISSSFTVGIKLRGKVAPFTCDSSHEGWFWADTSAHAGKYCNGTSFISMAGTPGGSGASFGVWSVIETSTGGSQSSVGGASTSYGTFAPVGASSFLNSHGLNVAESQRQMLTPVAVTLSNFCVSTVDAQAGDGSLVLTIRDNGANTALTVTFAAGAAAGTQCDATHSVAVASGHSISFSVTNNTPATQSADLSKWAVAYK